MIEIVKTDIVGWGAAIRGMRNPMNSWEKSDSYRSRGMLINEDRYEAPGFYIGPNDLNLMKKLRNAGTDHRKFMRYIIVYLDITAPLYWWKEFETYRAGVYPGQEPINPMDIEMNSCSTMHKIHANEFTPDDFSHEHLINYEDCLGIWKENHDLDPRIEDEDSAKYPEEAIEMWSFAPMDILILTIKALNHYRDLYLATKDKKYWWQMIQLLPSSYNQKRTVMLNYEVLANIYKSRKNHKLDEWHTFCDWIEALPYSELIVGEENENDSGAVLP